MISKDRIPAGNIKKLWWGFFILIGLLATPLMNVIAGVLVAPSVIVISAKGRSGRMTLQNPTNSPKEVSIGFSFGIPESDSLGNVNIHLQDSAVTDPQSALGWLKAFPRKLIIPPNGTQIVRFVANPPKGLKDGEYWARVVVESQEGTTSIPVASDDEQITTQLNMIMRTAVMIKYRTGELTAELDLVDLKAKMADSLIELLFDFSNKGNVSYIGTLDCRISDADNQEIGHQRVQLAVYHDLRRKLTFPAIESDFKKPYQVEVNISNKGRKDIPDKDLIFGNEIKFTRSINDKK